MRKMLLFTMLVCPFILQNCAPYSNIETSGSAARAPKPDHYTISVFRDGESLPSHAKVIGSVYVGDIGFSLGCGLERVIELAKEKAREVGGDAIQITETKSPDFFSTCYRINANVIALDKRRLTTAQTGKNTTKNSSAQPADVPEPKPVKMPSGHRWQAPK